MLKNILKRLTSLFHWFQKASLKKKLLVIAVVGVALFLLVGPLFGGNQQQQITTDTVKKATIVDTVSESGNIQSNQLTVYSVTNGVIEELYVENGQSVQKGDNLFKVKSTASDQDKASAYASYLSAQSTLNSAKSKQLALQATMFQKWDTFRELAESDSYQNDDGTPNYTNRALPEFHIPEKEWLAAEEDYKNQQGVISQAQASLNSAWLSYQATQNIVVNAQVGGTVSNLSYGVGDQVTASMNTSSNTDTTASSVLVIGTDTENVVKIQINEVDVNKIKVEQEATVTVSAIKDKTFKGKVTRVDDYGTETSGVITYNVYIKIIDPNEQIKPLMSAIVTIQTTKHENALVVPNNAVKPYKGGKAVQIKDTSKPGNQLKYVEVKTGIKNASQTEILEGVTEGMEVVTSTIASSTTTQSGGGLLGGPPN